MRLAFRCALLYPAGYRNFLDVQIRHHPFQLNLEGVRVLHLSDLHLDLDEGLCQVLIEKISRLQFELCVITGDFADKDSTLALQRLEKLRAVLGPWVYGILGNHDCLEMVPALTAMEIRILLDETVCWQDQLYLSGAINPYRIGPAMMDKMRKSVPEGAPSLLLAHSPDSYLAAAAAGYDVMLAGHTHGGQICLPGGFPLLRNSRAPRPMLHGPWQYEKLQGYTSAGTGSCGVPLRFFCPPEIVIHRLTSFQDSPHSGELG